MNISENSTNCKEIQENVVNFMLQYLLPLPVLRRSYKLRLFTENKQLQVKDKKDFPPEVSDVKFIGSQYEGLSVTVTSKDGGGAIYAMSDFDTMTVLRDYLVVQQGDAPETPGNVEHLEILSASHPGYCKLKSTATGNLIGMRFNEDCTGKVDIYSNGVLVKNINIPYQLVIPGFFEMPDTIEIKTYVHGPAIACTKIQVHPGDITRTGQEVDVVLSLKCHSWPKVATEFFTRKRNNWPKKEIIDSVIKTGCYVVAVAHAQSTLPEAEWRYSFAPAEKILARSLTYAQKGSYIVAKIMLKSVLDESDNISSYCLKTEMFWLCEREPTQWVYKDIGRFTLTVLRNLAASIDAHVLRQFIVPENNIIDHISNATLKKAAAKLHQLVANPLPVLANVRQMTKYFGAIIHPSEDVFQPITSLLVQSVVEKDEVKAKFSEARRHLLLHYCSMLTRSITNQVQEEFAKVKFALFMNLSADIALEEPETTLGANIDLVTQRLALYNKDNVSKWQDFASKYIERIDTIEREDVENILPFSDDGILLVEAF